MSYNGKKPNSKRPATNNDIYSRLSNLQGIHLTPRINETAAEKSLMKQDMQTKLTQPMKEDPCLRAAIHIDKDTHFINPYTFIPIDNREPERKPIEKGDKTGVIECSIEVSSPIFIPNTTRRFETDVKDHYHQEFYSYDDLSDCKQPVAPKNPVIPGSELRGMIRNVYEQLTNSCFLVVDENNLPYKRSPKPKEQGILKWNGKDWVLYTKEDGIIVHKLGFDQRTRTRQIDYDISTDSYKYDGRMLSCGDKLYIKASSKSVLAISLVEQPDFEEYTLHLTGHIKSKKNVIAFKEYTGVSKGIIIGGNDIERLKQVLDSYCDDKINKAQQSRYYKQYRQMLIDHRTVFVYFERVNNNYYLSPSCMTKEYFVNTIADILNMQHKHSCCINKDELCPACRLFGMIGKDGSAAGRVRVADTYTAYNIAYSEPYIMPILGNPRVSSTEFYLVRPNDKADMWNYDYWVMNLGRGRFDYKPYNPILRGRKVYWHGRLFDKCERSRMNSTAHCITEGAFKFKVYFEDLTETELKNLVFALTLNNEEKCMHKIGHGKPIGMGDIKITIDNIKYRQYVIEDGKIIAKFIPHMESWSYECKILDETDSVRYILKYTGVLTPSEKEAVDYPRPLGDHNIFNWFSNNRGSVARPQIEMILPMINDKNQALPKRHENMDKKFK